MKRIILILLVVILLACGTSAWGACPEDSFDRGKCDTMYVETWDTDTLLQGNGPYFVRVPIYVTADVADDCDSIRAFVIPLRYTHTNPTRYCSVSAYWNNGVSFTNPRSIFRHLVADGDTLYNWMMDLYQAGNGEEWNFIALNLDGTSHFWLALFPTGSEDPRFGSGSRILLATMTFKVEDTMQICTDTCFWPPSSRLGWVVADTFIRGIGCGTSYSKIPRSATGDPNSFEVCFNVQTSPFLCGDANGDGVIDVGDVVYLVNYLFKNGPAPIPLQAGDVTRDGVVAVGDVVYLINYLFKNGPPPCER